MDPTLAQSLMYLFVAAGGFFLRHALGTSASGGKAVPAPTDLKGIMLAKLQQQLENWAHSLLDGHVASVTSPAAAPVSPPVAPAPAK